jgi:multidrug efflux pump subunit AcrB
MASELIKGGGKKKKVVSYLIYTAATAIFIAIVYAVLFSPAGSAGVSSRSKLNSNLPDGDPYLLPDDKASAYEDLAQLNEARMRGLGMDELNVDLAQLNDSVQAQQEYAREKEESSDGEAGDAVADARQAAGMLQQRGGNARRASTPAVAEASDEQRERESASAQRKQELDRIRRRNEQAQELIMQILQQQQQQGQGGQKALPVAGRHSEDDASAAAADAESVSAIPDNHGEIATSLGGRARRSGGFYGRNVAASGDAHRAW